MRDAICTALLLMSMTICSTRLAASDQSDDSPSESAASVAHPAPDTPDRSRPSTATGRPLLHSLYIASVVLQGYDAYSTLTALSRGAVELNPAMKRITQNPATFVAVKAGVSTASIVLTERLWKDDHRVTAILSMVVTNGLMAYVAANNARALNTR